MGLNLVAQELDFNVKVIASPSLSQVDPKIFNSLEGQIEEFINNTKWTDDEFEEEERIKGNLQITITEDISPTSFVADILIQSIRPVFNSDYSTQVINYKDEGIPFTYVQLQPLENNVNDYKDNLSSVLLFYVYYVLGVDYDTFSPMGGERFLQMARNIASIVPPGSGGNGWSISVRDSRTTIIETLLNPRSRRVREAYYYYHRLGLDEASGDLGKAKASMVSAIKDVQAVNAAAPNSMAVQMFMDAKRKEIVEIFKQSDTRQISQMYDMLTEIDPSQAKVYNELRQK
uniref:type IX secretion system protein PorD n=1 Tax=Portibacter marinus TaxID=2898660 RepID=UPI001F344308|nr:DUF4835 family protein [Portibacter marinus]